MEEETARDVKQHRAACHVGKTKRGKTTKVRGERKNMLAGILIQAYRFSYSLKRKRKRRQKLLETCPNLICPEASVLCEPVLTHTHAGKNT